MSLRTKMKMNPTLMDPKMKRVEMSPRTKMKMNPTLMDPKMKRVEMSPRTKMKMNPTLMDPKMKRVEMSPRTKMNPKMKPMTTTMMQKINVSMTQSSALGTKQRKIALGLAKSVANVVESVGMEPCFRKSVLKHAEHATDFFFKQEAPYKGIIGQQPNQ
jgi:hypothetical protein